MAARGRRPKVQVRQGRLNYTSLTELPEGASVMTGTFLVLNQAVVVLFDSGASHSFIGNKAKERCGLSVGHTKEPYVIATPG
ncbi:hypothetical protein, partial [Klebsiella pneumoniae]|uniref:hypothetical protein n=1 Tax=Klebsiella pneumoniae TaxID=573 RepID=UPI0034E03EF1